MTDTSNTAADRPIRIGIVGLGKIAQDQHIPVIRADKRFELVAAASPNSTVHDIKVFTTLEEMLQADPEIEAVALCTPPIVRPALARTAIAAGKHVMLEKPPAATVAAAEDLVRRAQDAKVTLYATWHSRFAAAVGAARDRLAGKQIDSVEVAWKEDVRRWHPGQTWIFEAGGFGVFDPGINALSVVTKILPESMALETAELHFPSNRQAPIQADCLYRTVSGAPVHFDLNFLQTGPQTWDIRVKTKDGEEVVLHDGGDTMEGWAPSGNPPLHGEYAGLYDEFAKLVRSGGAAADLSPLIHVADAFLLGKRIEAPAFFEDPNQTA